MRKNISRKCGASRVFSATAEVLVADDTVFYKYPDRLRLPLVYYYAHTACFFINKMVLGNLLKVHHVASNF